MTAVKMIECRGKCKQVKAAVCFRPSDVNSERPVCRECRKGYEPEAARRVPGQKRSPAWRESARHIFVDAIARGRAV